MASSSQTEPSNDRQVEREVFSQSTVNCGREIVPLPFIRKMRYHLDSCSGTNKSQFVMGGLGLIVSTGRIDCVHLLYMVVGHTKFGPDLVARAIAGKFNSEDTFNHAMLNSHISKYGTVYAYDDEVLETWRRATPILFRPVENIMSYRSFLIIADDGKVDLTEVEPSGTMEKYPTKGKYYLWKDVVRQAEMLASRSLVKLIPQVMDGTYRGIGEGALPGIQNDASGARLLPRTVTETRTVRIFLQKCEADKLCLEQVPWMKDCSVSQVNKALRIVTAYSKVGSMGKTRTARKRNTLKNNFRNMFQLNLSQTNTK